MSQQIYLYGIAGADQMYRVVRYVLVEDEDISIGSLKRKAALMNLREPNIEHVYAMDQRYGLRRDYINAFKKNTIESWFIFKSILESEGLQIF